MNLKIVLKLKSELKKKNIEIEQFNKEKLKLNKTIESQQNEIENSTKDMFKVFDEVIIANTELNKRKDEIKNKSKEIDDYEDKLNKINQELEQLSLVASETDNVVIIMDKDGNFEWVNDSFKKLYGYEMDELITKISPNIIGKNTPKYVRRMVEKCKTSKKTVYYEQEIVTNFDKTIWVHVTLTPILDSENNIKKLIAIDSDITKLVEAEKEVKEHNKDIMESLNYASTIQRAILPVEKELDNHFSNFIIFYPRNIVSGDFYWYSIVNENGKQIKFLAVVDCTGHGVPGAFMSMLGTRLLNEIVNEKNIYNPSDILAELDNGVFTSLKQGETHNTDGMDIALCRFDEIEKGKIKVTYAGAKSSVFYVSLPSKKITRIKGDIKSIGGEFTKELSFNNYELNPKKGDMLYFASDGYMDQDSFVNERKSFGTISFMKLLRIISTRTIEKQKEKLESELRDFKAGAKQVDDITVLGIRV